MTALSGSQSKPPASPEVVDFVKESMKKQSNDQ